MRIRIPRVKDQVVLNKDTSFSILYVKQNIEFIKKLKEKLSDVSSIKYDDYYNLYLKKGTTLLVDRVYIRSGNNSSFDSITFRVKDCDYLPNGRFFLSIDDVNSSDFSFVERAADEVKEVNLHEYISDVEPNVYRLPYNLTRIYECKKERLINAHVSIDVSHIIETAYHFTSENLVKISGEDIDGCIGKILERNSRVTYPMDSRSLELIKSLDKETTLDKYEEFPIAKRATVELQKITNENDLYSIKDPYVLATSVCVDNVEYLKEAREFVSALILIYKTVQETELSSAIYKYDYSVQMRLETIYSLLETRLPGSLLFGHTHEIFCSHIDGNLPATEDYLTGLHKEEPIPYFYMMYSKYRDHALLSESRLGASELPQLILELDGKQITASELRKAFTKSKRDSNSSKKKKKKCHLKVVK